MLNIDLSQLPGVMCISNMMISTLELLFPLKKIKQKLFNSSNMLSKRENEKLFLEIAETDVQNLHTDSKRSFIGPKIELESSFKASEFPKEESLRHSNEFSVASIFGSSKYNESGSLPKKIQAISANSHDEQRNKSKENSKRNAILSKWSKTAIPLGNGSPRQRKKSGNSLAHMTLEDLLFRQKLHRFIRNLRSHAGMNETSRLNFEKLRLINDNGAYNNEILSKNLMLDEQQRSDGLLKKKLKQMKIRTYKKLIQCSKAQAYRLINAIRHKSRVVLTYVEDHVPVIKPFGRLKISWEILMLAMNFWNLVSLSLLVCFKISLQESVSLSISYFNSPASLDAFQLACLALYSIDIIIKFNSSFYLDGEHVTDRRKIFNNYIKGGLFFDVLGTVPFWRGLSKIEGDDGFLFFLLFKLYPLQHFFKNINDVLLTIEGKLEAVYYLVKLLFTVLIVCHIFACIWHLQAIEGDAGSSVNWLQKLGLQNSPWSERYLRSLYFTVVTMTTVGYGDIAPNNSIEYVIAMACMLIGSGLIGYSINSIGAILKKTRKTELEFRNKMQLLNGYLKKNNVDEALKIKVRKYLEYIWKVENSDNEKRCEEILKELPKSLCNELLTQSRIWAVQRLFSPKFKETTIKKLVSKLMLVQFSKEEWIFKEGDSSDNSLYIIAKGSVDLVLTEDFSANHRNILLDSLKVGQELGLYPFIIDGPREHSAKAASVCTLFKLERAQFLETLKESKEDYEIFCMMRDEMLLNKNLKPFSTKCKSCGDVSHLIQNCPQLTYRPFVGIIIKRHLHSKAQKRHKFRRIKRPLAGLNGKLSSLKTSDTTRADLKRFQEEKFNLIRSLSEFYSANLETNQHLIRESSRELTRQEIVESKERIFSKEDITGTEVERPKLPKLHSLAEMDSEMEMSDHPNIFSNENKRATQEIVAGSELRDNKESYQEIHKPPVQVRDRDQPKSEDISRNQLPPDGGSNTLKGFKSNLSKVLSAENMRNLLEDENEYFEKTRNTSLSQNTRKLQKGFDPPFERDFERSQVFMFYFPHNNKTEVIRRLAKKPSIPDIQFKTFLKKMK